MSANSSAKRGGRRNARAKLNLRVDLNSPPAEVADAAASQSSQAPASRGGGGGGAAAPIDLEASDDELQLLSSPRGFPQTRNHSRRRKRPVVVVVDDEREVRTGTSGVHGNCPATNKGHRIPLNRTVINCESYLVSEDDYSAKRRKPSTPVPAKVAPPKEPTFSCPICMSALVSPCSTACGHIFCEACIKAAIQVKKECPTCRRRLAARNNFHKVFLPTATVD